MACGWLLLTPSQPSLWRCLLEGGQLELSVRFSAATGGNCRAQVRPEESVPTPRLPALVFWDLGKCSTIFYLITGCTPFWDGGCALASSGVSNWSHCSLSLLWPILPHPPCQSFCPEFSSKSEDLGSFGFPSCKGILENRFGKGAGKSSALYSRSEFCLFFPLSANP